MNTAVSNKLASLIKEKGIKGEYFMTSLGFVFLDGQICFIISSREILAYLLNYPDSIDVFSIDINELNNRYYTALKKAIEKQGQDELEASYIASSIIHERPKAYSYSIDDYSEIIFEILDVLSDKSVSKAVFEIKEREEFEEVSKTFSLKHSEQTGEKFCIPYSVAVVETKDIPKEYRTNHIYETENSLLVVEDIFTTVCSQDVLNIDNLDEFLKEEPFVPSENEVFKKQKEINRFIREGVVLNAFEIFKDLLSYREFPEIDIFTAKEVLEFFLKMQKPEQIDQFTFEKKLTFEIEPVENPFKVNLKIKN